MTKPTVVFCSGAWHTEVHIQPCVPYFEEAGYKIIPAPLYATGHETNTDETIEHIQNAVTNELASNGNVCLVLHSAAGILGSEAVNRVLASSHSADSGKIVHIIYVNSFLGDHLKIIKHLLENGIIDVDMEKNRSTPRDPYGRFFHEMSRDEAEPFLQALTFHTNLQPMLSSDMWMGVRRTSVVCLEDRCIPSEFQETDVVKYGMEMVRMRVGHDPFVTRPEEFVRVVRGILEG